MTPKMKILDQNFAHFGRFEGVIFDHFGVKNSLSRNFRFFFSVPTGPRSSKIDPKIDTFDQFYNRDLAILGVKKVDFSTFSKLFWTCLGSVWALF